MNWCQTERMNLKYVEINWNVIFSKIILILIRKGKRAVPVQLYIFIIFMCLQRWIWINLKLMNWCQTERMNLKYVEINWNVIFSKIILILIRKGKRAVPVQLYIFIIFMCLQRWIWINLKLMNWCQTERMNLKYVEINWNVIFSKIILILIQKGKRAVPVQIYIFIIFMCLQRWIWINLKLMDWCQTERMNLKYVEINWNVIFSKIILILIRKGKRAVPVQLYIFIIFMCLQRWIWINLKLMNWCQTERMNLKYVEINWNVIFSKIILILIWKGKRAVPVQLYIFIIFMCLLRWIWINLKLMNWCQTERMNLKYVEINWNVIFQKSFSSWF